MGYRTYVEFDGPLGIAPNYVVVRSGPLPRLNEGFTALVDLEPFFQRHADALVWVIGGGDLFRQSMPFAGELYITQLQENFHCTRFFPEFLSEFHLAEHQPTITEDGIQFQFQIWHRDARVGASDVPQSPETDDGHADVAREA